MKNLALAFMSGIVFASAIWVALLRLSPDEKTNGLQTLDYLIDEWTSQRDELIGDTRQAQLSSRVELPDAHPGYFPDTVKALANRLQTKYRIPEGVTLAQWALESSWGRNNLEVSNYFGHTWLAVLRFKKDSLFVLRREKITVETGLATGQVVRFASYKSIAECFDTHGRYLSQSGRYRNAFAMRSPEAFALQLSKAGYATDPDYGLKLVAIMRRYRL